MLAFFTQNSYPFCRFKPYLMNLGGEAIDRKRLHSIA